MNVILQLRNKYQIVVKKRGHSSCTIKIHETSILPQALRGFLAHFGTMKAQTQNLCDCGDQVMLASTAQCHWEKTMSTAEASEPIEFRLFCWNVLVLKHILFEFLLSNNILNSIYCRHFG